MKECGTRVLIAFARKNGARRSRRESDQVVHIANPHLYAWAGCNDWERSIVLRNKSDPGEIGIPGLKQSHVGFSCAREGERGWT